MMYNDVPESVSNQTHQYSQSGESIQEAKLYQIYSTVYSKYSVP